MCVVNVGAHRRSENSQKIRRSSGSPRLTRRHALCPWAVVLDSGLRELVTRRSVFAFGRGNTVRSEKGSGWQPDCFAFTFHVVCVARFLAGKQPLRARAPVQLPPRGHGALDSAYSPLFLSFPLLKVLGSAVARSRMHASSSYSFLST